ncbi:hypothetical protein ACFYS8_21600 [Kitasatospora sp. NPDC004615]|uniref:hypothetical protein n=1 Tax=Kitasatospora sp. NPDC004615 TaxID=3364017 RepID=UPI0036AD95D7
MSTPPPHQLQGHRSTSSFSRNPRTSPATGVRTGTVTTIGPDGPSNASDNPNGTGTDGPGPGRPRHRLWWGIGGALVASAVWAATILTVPTLINGDSTTSARSVAGYRTVDDLCTTARLTTFSQLYPVPTGTPYHYTTRHRALDEMYCGQYRKKVGGDQDYYTLYLQVQLHHEVDPRPEFDAQREGLAQRHYQISPVPGLGDAAYIGYLDDPDRGAPGSHYLTQVLYVRQGGMTCYTSWSASYQDGRGTAPDREQVRTALLSDTRELLRTLGGST